MGTLGAGRLRLHHLFQLPFSGEAYALYQRRGFPSHLELKGSAAKVLQTYADAFASHPILMEDNCIEVAPSDDFYEYELDIQVPNGSVTHGIQN